MASRGCILTLLLVTGLAACSDDTAALDGGGADATADAVQGDGPGTTDGSAADGPAADGPVADQGGGLDLKLSGDAALFPKCSAKGGLCTKHRWVVCPVNYEPIHPGPHQDCTGGGWCCVKAPPSSCSAKAGVNCVYGNKCTGCWFPARDTTLTCESGRVCCMDMCD